MHAAGSDRRSLCVFSRIFRPLAFPAAVCAFLLTGCGGGGGSAPDKVASASPPDVKSPSVALSETSVAVTADTSGTAPQPAVIDVTTANAPSAGVLFTVTSTGPAVSGATYQPQSPAAGQLAISFPDPKQLGAGTYTATIQLQACTDTACAQAVTGSPASISVTYTVTGAALLTPSFYFVDPISSFESTTAQTSAQTMTVQVDFMNIPPAGLYLKIQQPRNGFMTNISDTESPTSTGGLNVDLNLTLVAPATLGSGFFDSSLTFMVCYDQACSQQIPGSPVTQPVHYTVYLSPGKEYNLINVAQSGGVSDLAYDSANQSLYVTALAGYVSSSYTGAVTQVDPLTGTAGAQTQFSDSLSAVATSDDGTYLYAGSSDTAVIHRLKLPSLQADLDIPLGSSGDPNTGGGINIVGQMAVAPGAPETLAVALAHPHSIQTGGTVIFDSATPRQQILAPLGDRASPDAIAWSDTSALLYAYRYSYQLPFDMEVDSVLVNGSGLAVQNAVNITGSLDSVSQIFYDQGRLYDLIGYVRDASTGAVLGQFIMPGNQGPLQLPPNDEIVAMAPDTAHGRAYFLVHNSQSAHLRLYNFDSTSYTLLAVADLGYDSFDVSLKTRMIVWEASGGVATLAANRQGLQILSGSFYAAPAASSSDQRVRRIQVGPQVRSVHIMKGD